MDLANFLPPQYTEDTAEVREWVTQFLPRRGTIPTRDILANLSAAIRNTSDTRRVTRWARSVQPRRSTCAAERVATWRC